MIELRHKDRTSSKRQLTFAMAFHVGEKLRDAPCPQNQFAEVFHELFLTELMNSAARVGAFAFEPHCEEE